MKGKVVSSAVLSFVVFAASAAFAQNKPSQELRRPAAGSNAQQSQPQDSDGSVFFQNGLPMLFKVHHDTEVDTGRAVDVDELVVELQVMNSDGNPEPVGLQIHDYFTAQAQDPKNAFNKHTAHDCHTWNNLIVQALRDHKKIDKTWPYLEFIITNPARTIQTNEHGRVFWSDDIQCWGSMDRFPPF
jgi:hypothetical protein